VRLDDSPDEPERIYSPYLEIEYRERFTQDILKKDENKLTRVIFISEYFMSTNGFWKSVTTIFWILIGILSSLVLIQICVTCKTGGLETN